MAKPNLPDDLVGFLKAGARLQYDAESVEPGLVGLTPLSELKTGVVWINSDQSPLADDDPHASDEGYYEVPAVSLTSECEAYDAEFILLWLPNERMYGTWDCDHWDLLVFPETTWSDIVADPGKFIDAQWSDTDRAVSEYFKPYPKYKFKKGSPF